MDIFYLLYIADILFIDILFIYVYIEFLLSVHLLQCF